LKHRPTAGERKKRKGGKERRGEKREIFILLFLKGGKAEEVEG